MTRTSRPLYNPPMKAVLVLPPFRDFYNSPGRLSALGLRSLEAVLEERGWETRMLLFPLLVPRGRTVPLPRELDYLKPYLIPGETGPLSWFTAYRQFGPDPEAAAEAVRDERPDLVLVSAFAWAYAEEARDTARSIRRLLPEAPLVLGGGACSVLPEYFARPDTADFLFVGEAEPGFRQFLEILESGRRPGPSDGIHNLMFPGVPAPVRADSREQELHPVWARVSPSGAPRYATVLSRGCPRGCRFCSNRFTHGTRFRTVPEERILASLEELPREGELHVNFEDDNLLLQREAFLRILRTLKARNPRFRFSAENGMDYTLLSPEVLEELAGLGLSQLNLSLAAPRRETALRERRFLDWERFDRVIARAAVLGIPVIAYFICGLEGDSPTGTVEILAGLSARPVTLGISLYYPVPGLEGIPGFGSPETFLSLPPRLCAGSSARPWTGALSTSEMLTAFRLARYANLRRRGAASPREQLLLDRCRETGRLYTLRRFRGAPELAEVPGMDREMTLSYFRLIRDP